MERAQYLLSEINARCREDAAGFIAEGEEAYSGRLQEAADKILNNFSTSPIVLLSGPSGSGKTTTAHRLCDTLESHGVKTHVISLDDYFSTVNPETTPRTETGAYDLESPLCLNMDLLNDHFTALSNGERIDIPHYDFVHQRSEMLAGRGLKLGKDEIAIFEGIHALNDAITNVHPEAFKLYISARSNVVDDDGDIVVQGPWLRLMRRSVRDYLFRGTAAKETLTSWANIRKGETLYISPFKNKADYQLDSSFPFEVPVLNNMATELFLDLPETTPGYDILRRLLPIFELFEDISPDLLPWDSMLREFVGGGKYS